LIGIFERLEISLDISNRSKQNHSKMKAALPMTSYLLGVALIPPINVLGLNTLACRSIAGRGCTCLSSFRTNANMPTRTRLNYGSRFSSLDTSGSSVFLSKSTTTATVWNKNRINFPFSLNRRRYSPTSIYESATATGDTDKIETKRNPVPITLLSGFLGSGKTSALKSLLENRNGIKVGVVVNDVASVNIDAKLISNPSEFSMEQDSTVELQNGCACCSLADELLDSVQSLMEGRDFDAIVVELSGIADPIAVVSNWEDAKMNNHPSTKLADMGKVVTVIDASTFGTDWMTWNVAGEREGWVEEDDCAAGRHVPELLAEQIEAADILLINKVDLADAAQVKTASLLAKSLNDKNATMFEVSFGKVDPSKILGLISDKIPEKEETTSIVNDPKNTESTESDCTKPDCTDTTHDHSHSHNEHDSGSKSTSHDHDHAISDCTESDCTDPTHDHAHSHDHAASDCSDPICTDPTHDHSHSHDHASTTIDNLGIVNFVYKSGRPFSARRLLVLLNTWPIPIKDELDLGQLSEATQEGISDGQEVKMNPFVGVLRSKGFTWMSPSVWDGPQEDVWRHNTAMFWSHAGKHFGINTAGKWWASIEKEEMKNYFTTNMKEYERILSEDWSTDEFGDRRQEIVFIGAGIDQKEITEKLDDCLLDDKEMDEYRKQLKNYIDSVYTSQGENA